MRDQVELKYEAKDLKEKCFKYDLSEIYSGAKDYPGEALSSLEKDTAIYCEWINELVGD